MPKLTPQGLAEVIALSAMSHVPVMVHGPSGVGKTSMAKDLARSPLPHYRQLRRMVWGSEEPVDFVNVRASQLEPTDFGGLPYVSDNFATEGEADVRVTYYAPPAYMPGKNPHLGKNGILCLDEFFRAVENTMQAMFELIEVYEDPHTGRMCHKIGDNYLPEGWHVIALTNPQNSDNFIQNPFRDRALFNRFSHVWFGLQGGVVDEYIVDWTRYMSRTIQKKYGRISKRVENVLGVAQDMPKFLFGKAIEEKRSFGLDLAPSPAGWEKVARVVHNYEMHEKDISSNAFEEMVHGLVGQEAFRAFKKANLPASPSDIINIGRPAWRKVLSDKELRPSTLSSMVAIVHSFVPHIEEETDKKLRRKKMTNFCEFLYDVSGKYSDVDARGARYESRDVVSMVMRDILRNDVGKILGSEDPMQGNKLGEALSALMEVGFDTFVDLMEEQFTDNDNNKKGNISWLLILNKVIDSRRKEDSKKADKVKSIVSGVLSSKLWLDVFNEVGVYPENENGEDSDE